MAEDARVLQSLYEERLTKLPFPEVLQPIRVGRGAAQPISTPTPAVFVSKATGKRKAAKNTPAKNTPAIAPRSAPRTKKSKADDDDGEEGASEDERKASASPAVGGRSSVKRKSGAATKKSAAKKTTTASRRPPKRSVSGTDSDDDFESEPELIVGEMDSDVSAEASD